MRYKYNNILPNVKLLVLDNNTIIIKVKQLRTPLFTKTFLEISARLILPTYVYNKY